MEQMIANGIQLIKTDSNYNFTIDTVNYRHQIPFANQKNLYDASICEFAQPIDFSDISVLQFLTTEVSVTCEVRDYTGTLLDTIAATNVGTYDTQNVFNLEIDWSTVIGNLEHCYLQINDGTEYFKSEPLRSIDQRAKIKLRYRMLRNHKNIGYFFNPSDEAYEFFHILYIEAELTDFQRVNDKSVFRDSNQKLLNLFATFRHSFLCRTWQVGYYLHEKVNTLSYCDEIYLSETKGGNTYEGRIFLGEDEFSEVERIEQTNLYVSSTRFVTNNAFRLVGAAQETPIVPEPNLGIVPIQHTKTTGKKATFQTPYKLLPSKFLYTPQGLPTDYLFKVGGNTPALRDANNIGWDSIASLTFAEFSALTVNADSYIQVRYIGSLTQSYIVASLHAPISDAPINPSTRSFTVNAANALSDMIFYPAIITGFDSVGIGLGSASIFSAQRTFDNLANSETIFDFVNGISNLPITTAEGLSHLHLENGTSSNLTINVTSNQSDNKKEIIGYCNPLGNFGYPITSDGSNPQALFFDRVSDIGTLSSAATYFDFTSNSDNTFFEFCFVYRESPRLTPAAIRLFTNSNSLGSSVFEIIVAEGANRPSIIEGPTNSSLRHLLSAGSTLANNGVYQVYIRLKKASSTGNTSTRFDLTESFAVVNGHKTSFTVLNEGTALASDVSDTSFVGGANTAVASAADAPQRYYAFAGNAGAASPILDEGLISEFMTGNYTVLTALEAYYPLNTIASTVVANQGVGAIVGDFTQTTGSDILIDLF